jgi:outer membrane immunogenic protein
MMNSLTKFLLVSVAVVGAILVVGSSFAGPMSAEKNVTPMAPAPACDWSGFYIGLNAGVTNYTLRITDVDDWDSFSTREYDTGAFIGGGQVGYNLQFGQLVLGVEADASGSTAKISKSSNGEDQFDYGKVDFLTTARLRMGVAFDKALVYVTGGGAYAHGKWEESYVYPPYHPIYGNYYDAYWLGDDWRWGWCGGAGIEYMLNCHWSIRAEALYTWLEDDTKPVTGPAGGYYITVYPNYYKFTFDDDLWSYRVGVNYKFGSLFGH